MGRGVATLFPLCALVPPPSQTTLETLDTNNTNQPTKGPFNREFRDFLLTRDFYGGCVRLGVPVTQNCEVRGVDVVSLVGCCCWFRGTRLSLQPLSSHMLFWLPPYTHTKTIIAPPSRPPLPHTQQNLKP